MQFVICASRVLTALFVVCLASDAFSAEPLDDSKREFFESKIRPILVEHCYECHSSAGETEGGLSLDHRSAAMNGGDSGLIFDFEQPSSSQIIKVLKHEIEGLEMPEGGPKLSDEVVRDFERWIQMGAPDPRDAAPTKQELSEATSWSKTLERRKQWWSFQPIADIKVPDDGKDGVHPIDAFINSKIQAEGLTASPAADAATVVRRLYFALTGLPPSSEDAGRWSNAIQSAGDRKRVVEDLVDSLLDSPRFGERWARHWMDWVRYAESHGSEGDPRIENAWQYRDYLIRALNEDVPYDQLVKEHVAGDLLESPRVNPELGIDESTIGTAHWRMVFHGFAPTDALDEKVRFVDDQINVFSKAFLGLTVSCARCHDHKFDAISQADYYALFGILASCRPGRNVIETGEVQTLHRDELAALKQTIRDELASVWMQEIDHAARRLVNLTKPNNSKSALASFVNEVRAMDQDDSEIGSTWKSVSAKYQGQLSAVTDFLGAKHAERWDLAEPESRTKWNSTGIGLADSETAIQFAISDDVNTALRGIYPKGSYTHLISDKHAGRLTSPDFDAGEDQAIWVQAIGGGDSSARYVVQDYPRRGTVYPVSKMEASWRWYKFDLSYWSGDSIHVELTAGKDAPLLTAGNGRSWFGIRNVMVAGKELSSPNPTVEAVKPLLDAATGSSPESIDDFIAVTRNALQTSLSAWQIGNASDAQSLFLDECLQASVLDNSSNQSKRLSKLVTRYRALEQQIRIPTRVPGLEETIGSDQAMMIRGNHKTLGDPVPRRFLEAIDDSPYQTDRSGRLELSNDLLRNDNPLTRRVIVNRIWHHLFGRGIVSTPDNFGRLGSPPTHLELLDWLANRFADDGWSMKQLIRMIVLSETWQRSSVASNGGDTLDPENKWLARASVRRLEAEAIRDSLLNLSGRLDPKMFGPPVSSSVPRRSVYLNVIRNSLDPFLAVFDYPEPFSTVGRRDVTNVPAQSLALLNDPQTVSYANELAKSERARNDSKDVDGRLAAAFMKAFGRKPSNAELEQASRFYASSVILAGKRVQRSLELEKQIREHRDSINGMLNGARTSVLSKSKATATASDVAVPNPVAGWDFSESLKDRVGSADVLLRSGAHQSKDGLVVSGGGYALTDPVSIKLVEKTLEAWVKLDNLNQRGGGVMTVQSPNGVDFDSIVFGERSPRKWLAGSNGFTRTNPFEGDEEHNADSLPVHFAITYGADGTITGYRNGVRYGTSYQSSGPKAFPADNVLVSFGLRHLPAGGNRLLSGVIVKARLYDQALNADQIAASSTGMDSYISETRLLEELSESDRKGLVKGREQLANLLAEHEKLDRSDLLVETQAWADFARAIISFKEFIYVR